MQSIHFREIIKLANFENVLTKMPDNRPLESLSNAFVKTWKLYGVEEAVIVFLVCDDEINIADQRELEYAILEKESKIRIYRSTLANFYDNSYLDEDKTLY